MTNNRKWVIVTVLVLILMPLALVVIEARSFYVDNRNSGSFVSSGQTREYLLYVPRSYDRTKPTPLVISMHGAAGWPAQQMNISGWNRLAESEGLIVVYPSGMSGSGPRVWRGGLESGLTPDVTFISDLIGTLEVAYNIDPARIYANGVSNGAGMAFVLSCTLSDQIAAFGLVAAAHTTEWGLCTDQRPVPMITFHGTADRLTPYNGGGSVVAPRPFPNIPGFTANWARRNRCDADPVEAVVAANVTRREYANCADEAGVVFYTVRGGGHTWPGGGPLPEWLVGPNNREIDATSVMWEFFREHPLRPLTP